LQQFLFIISPSHSAPNHESTDSDTPSEFSSSDFDSSPPHSRTPSPVFNQATPSTSTDYSQCTPPNRRISSASTPKRWRKRGQLAKKRTRKQQNPKKHAFIVQRERARRLKEPVIRHCNKNFNSAKEVVEFEKRESLADPTRKGISSRSLPFRSTILNELTQFAEGASYLRENSDSSGTSETSESAPEADLEQFNSSFGSLALIIDTSSEEETSTDEIDPYSGPLVLPSPNWIIYNPETRRFIRTQPPQHSAEGIVSIVRLNIFESGAFESEDGSSGDSSSEGRSDT
jgi:hypothetical protein